MNHARHTHWLLALSVSAAVLLTACADDGGDDGTPAPNNAVPNNSANNDTPTCFQNPTTHIEIINACTDATPVNKTPVTPLLNPDGTLPPLP